ncbi:type II toxin-antitoxin system RelE/ParE family toxin, partial [Photobacterium profundum]|uniref:type II toxin-antitoxin system RelE/ParE family toxin n=1 Tax=Photobacterium profundum TaxID=74109 RepID=UPI003D0A3B64
VYYCNRLKILNPKVWGYSGVIYKLRVDCKKESVRILFVKIKNNNLVILHSFIKKTRKTPNKEAKIAIHNFNQLGGGENLRPLNLNKYLLTYGDVKRVSI